MCSHPSCNLDFSKLNGEENSYFFTSSNNNVYCVLHLPWVDKKHWETKKNNLEINRKLGLFEYAFRQIISNQGTLSYFIFPPDYQFTYDIKKYKLKFVECDFEHLSFNTSSSAGISFSRCNFYKFSNICNISPTVLDSIVIEKCVFADGASFKLPNTNTFIMSNNVFFYTLFIMDGEISTTFRLEDNFIDNNIVISNFVIPQESIFKRNKFVKLDEESESSFRSIRSQLSKHVNRYDEGLFYAFEQRCHRKRFKWYNPFRLISFLYDYVSLYGLSYERLIFCFLTLQLLFYFEYASMADKVDFFSKVNIFVFTFGQLFKPFDIFSIKHVEDQKLQSVLDTSIPFITAIHSLLSFSIFALILIALRWRFKRG